MKRLFLILCIATPLYAAMSDPSAMKLARQKWGDQADTGMRRYGFLAPNWTRLVGVMSKGCHDSFTVFGEGYNTWEAAFMAADFIPPVIHGPFKGTVTVKALAYDVGSVTSFQFMVDSKPWGSVIIQNPSSSWDVMVPLNTTALSNDIHVICATAKDNAGNQGAGAAMLFKVDQNIATAIPEWQLPQKFEPVLSNTSVF